MHTRVARPAATMTTDHEPRGSWTSSFLVIQAVFGSCVNGVIGVIMARSLFDGMTGPRVRRDIRLRGLRALIRVFSPQKSSYGVSIHNTGTRQLAIEEMHNWEREVAGNRAVNQQQNPTKIRKQTGRDRDSEGQCESSGGSGFIPKRHSGDSKAVIANVA
ncbi:hypothetical protein QBC43DRAFT_370650 [Cladorrhinum sp. PSN259]|nr:hypothetical protein QBC43DRAFT_370650 [Cladorrhinum sp. PSN259]